MPYAGLDPKLLGAMSDPRITSEQKLILQSVLQGIDPHAYVSQHAATRLGIRPTLDRLEHSLRTFSVAGQPHFELLMKLVSAAREACGRAASMTEHSDFVRRLGAAIADAESLTEDSRSGAMAVARQLAKVTNDLDEYLREIFTQAWNKRNSASDGRFLEFVLDEIVCVVATSGRDRQTLEMDLAAIYTDTSSPVTAELIFSIVCPPLRLFHHACQVLGTSSLLDIDALRDEHEGEGEALTGPASVGLNWGPANPKLKAWLERQVRPGRSVVISLKVRAVDRASASRQGRRQMHEMLDQYVAGNRTTALRLADQGFTCEVGASQSAEHVLRLHTQSEVRPLVARWPKDLRQALRMSHLARMENSPHVANSLAWAAIEAAGVDADGRANLARALALQAFRQQLMGSFLSIENDLRAQHSYWAVQSRTAGKSLEKLNQRMGEIQSDAPGEEQVLQQSENLERTQRDADAKVDLLVPGIETLASMRTSGVQQSGVRQVAR